MDKLINQIRDIQAQIETLKNNWPAHSVNAVLMETLDELEEALEKAQAELAERIKQSENEVPKDQNN